MKNMKILVSNINFWIEPIIITSSDSKSFNDFKEKYNIEIKNVYGDATVLKTIIRSNPGFFLLRNGTVTGRSCADHFKSLFNDNKGVFAP